MEKYKFYRLNDVCSRFSSGKGISASEIHEEGPYPVFGGNGIRGYAYKKNFDGKCAIIGRQGAYCGNVKYFEGEAYMTEHAVIAVTKPEHNPRYLSYVLDGLKLGRLSGQAAQPGLSVKKLGKLFVEMPCLEYQDKIAGVLENYEKAIKVNNERIDLLQRMALNVYKEWFIRFRYPGHEEYKLVNSSIGKIPETFLETKMEDVFKYYIGGGWGNEEPDKNYSEEAYVIRGADFPNVIRGDVSSCPLRYHKYSNYKKRELHENDIILEVSGGTAEQPVGRTILVNKDIIDRLDGKVICASFCKLIRLKENINPYYFYYWMQFLYDTRIIDRFQLQSTGIINFKFEYFLRKGSVMMPPKELMDKFEDVIKPLHDEIYLLARKNENLTKQRDLLIPRLMSGKLEL